MRLVILLNVPSLTVCEALPHILTEHNSTPPPPQIYIDLVNLVKLVYSSLYFFIIINLPLLPPHDMC